jgi:transcription antitermination factor NusA-like protein
MFCTSIAIGRQGQNVRLASKLTGYELDIETAQAEMKAAAPAAAPKRTTKNAEDNLLSAIEQASE